MELDDSEEIWIRSGRGGSTVYHVDYGRHVISRKWRHRIPLNLAIWRYRIRDAWAVLRGKADIGL